MRERLARRLTAEARELLPNDLVKRAVSDAEALAWSTSYPLLFLPALAEEKVAAARRWDARQREILERQRELDAVL